jgi:SAM-dependent methyltransferase
MKCKFCNGESQEKLREIKSIYTGQYYTLLKCSNCDSCYFDINEHPVNIDDLYSKLASQKDFPLKYRTSRYWSNQVNRIRKINSHVESILDVGCSSGDFLLHWPQDVYKVGVELSDKASSVAKQRGLMVINESVEKIDFRDAQFDVVTCYAVLEHLENPLPVIDKLSSLVKSGGLLVILIPSMQNFKANLLFSINYRWHMFSPPEHLNFYSKQFMDNYLLNKGFLLKDRIHTSGGMFNPFKKVPFLNQLIAGFVFVLDYYTHFSKLEIFDHMHSYYLKK